MARMYSRKHGKSGSSKPHREEAPEWIDISEKELEDEIKNLSEEGKTPSEIGIIIRDKYGIPSVKEVTGKKITDVISDSKEGLPLDLSKLLKRADEIRKHLKDNSKDSSAIHGLEETESKIRRLKKYYKRKGKIPEDWDYKPTKEYHKME